MTPLVASKKWFGCSGIMIRVWLVVTVVVLRSIIGIIGLVVVGTVELICIVMVG